jgi:hypothetical protein
MLLVASYLRMRPLTAPEKQLLVAPSGQAIIPSLVDYFYDIRPSWRAWLSPFGSALSS